PDLRAGVAAAHRGRYEHPVAPDDRAGVAEAGDRRLPADRIARLDVPRHRRVLPVRDAGPVRPAEGRPVERGGGRLAGGRRGRVRLYDRLLEAVEAVLGGEALHGDAGQLAVLPLDVVAG